MSGKECTDVLQSELGGIYDGQSFEELRELKWTGYTHFYLSSCILSFTKSVFDQDVILKLIEHDLQCGCDIDDLVESSWSMIHGKS